MKKILITGGTGSLGREVTRHFDKLGWEVTVLSRDVHKQWALEQELPDVRFVLSDVADYLQVANAVEDHQVVVHAAAVKHVTIGERAVAEYVRTNIDGTHVVAQACRDAGVEMALFISSDKACEPINLYGKTKAVGEDIFANYGYSVLRYGNVVNSRGAFIEIWKDLLDRGKSISVREPDPTRFFLTIQDAVDLVHACLERAPGVYVPTNLRAFSVLDVAKQMTNEERIGFSTLLPGEKQHEVLLSDAEYAVDLGGIICSVWKGHYYWGAESDLLDPNDFSSETASRMTGNEVLEILDRNTI